MAAENRSLRLCLWGLWLLCSAPAARALITEPRLYFLRSLPVPRWQLVLPQAFFLFFAELPMVALYGRGTSIVAGLASGLLAMAAHFLNNALAAVARWVKEH